MNVRLKSWLSKIPGLRSLVHWIRMELRIREARVLMARLYPLKTNGELIRLGPAGDGGYLIPNDLAGIHVCFSPGVSLVSGFEKDCANLGMTVFLADASVDGPADEHESFVFTKKFIGGTAREDFITLDDWVAASIDDAESDLMMQIDIEGHEYEVFLAATDALMRRFRILVVEFHFLDELLGIWSNKRRHIVDAFNRILQTHACVHIHPNNYCGYVQHNSTEIPRVMEFTFLRKDRISHSTYQTSFPHPLDCDNTPNPPLVLPKCWYHRGI